MNKSHLLSTVAAALMITAGAAYAQAPTKDQAPAAPAPAAQQKAPPEKVAPPMKAGERAKPAPMAHDVNKVEPGRGQSAQTQEHRPGTTAAKDSADPRKADIKTNADANKRADDAKPNDKTNARSTTGQGAAAGHARLSGEQRTKITTIIRDKKVEPVHLNVSINVGTRIPEHVRYYPLPSEVITIYPEWRGYDYILVGNQILVIDPGSREIVAILDA